MTRRNGHSESASECCGCGLVYADRVLRFSQSGAAVCRFCAPEHFRCGILHLESLILAEPDKRRIKALKNELKFCESVLPEIVRASRR